MHTLIEMPESSKKLLMEIGDRVLVRLREEYKVDLLEPTIPYAVDVLFREELANTLGRNPNTTIEIGSIESYTTDCEDTDNGEKAANIVPSHTFGEAFKLRVKNDNDTEEDEDD